jgi:hypothetical protein
MTKLLAAAFTFIFLAAPAQAHVFLEPDIGIEAGKANEDFKYNDGSPENKSNFSQNGITYGAALGYHYNRIYAAAEYEKGMGGHVTDISGLVGYNLGITFRIWIGYIFSAKDDISSGTGYKAGAGIPLTRIFRLNGEYDTRTYTSYTGAQTNTLNYTEKRNSFRLTISFPWQITGK